MAAALGDARIRSTSITLAAQRNLVLVRFEIHVSSYRRVRVSSSEVFSDSQGANPWCGPYSAAPVKGVRAFTRPVPSRGPDPAGCSWSPTGRYRRGRPEL